MTSGERTSFQKIVQDYYQQHGRHDLPWRVPDDTGFDAYKILVSELMLQQTQVARVIPKYGQFLTEFPTVTSLAAAPLGLVLTAWSGLGYNRRAKYLQQAAQQVVASYHGKLPTEISELVRLPGVGVNTAGAIVTYAYDRPVLFIETNIRSVYIHHFFAGQDTVRDRHILDVLAATMPTSNYRAWYWALMDYGSYLKRTAGNAAQHSTTYNRQSAFNGSVRQLRGQVLKRLTERSYTVQELELTLHDSRLPAVLTALQQEGLVMRSGQHLRI